MLSQFLDGEVRYNSLKQAAPADEAEQLFAKTEADAKARLQSYKDKAAK